MRRLGFRLLYGCLPFASYTAGPGVMLLISVIILVLQLSWDYDKSFVMWDLVFSWADEAEEEDTEADFTFERHNSLLKME